MFQHVSAHVKNLTALAILQYTPLGGHAAGIIDIWDIKYGVGGDEDAIASVVTIRKLSASCHRD